MIIINYIFNIIWKFQNFIVKIQNRIGKSKIFNIIKKISFSILIINIFLIAWDINHIIFYIAVIYMCVAIIYIDEFIRKAYKILTSLRSFLYFGIFTNFLISIIIASLIMNSTNNYNYLLTIFLIIFTIIWILISMLANTNVSTTANVIIAAFATILSFCKSYILDILLQWYLQSTNTNINSITIQELYSINYGIDNVLGKTYDNIIFPIIVINGISTCIAIIHSYWIKKYNNGNEI